METLMGNATQVPVIAARPTGLHQVSGPDRQGAGAATRAAGIGNAGGCAPLVVLTAPVGLFCWRMPL
jgi:hypothetical protein